MKLLRRLRLTFLFALLALMASGTAQQQLSFNVLDAALTNHSNVAGHTMPDGTFMAGAMHANAHEGHTDASQSGGHTHKGHADCTMCGAVAAMAALTLATPLAVPPPAITGEAFALTLTSVLLTRRDHAPYASRAPPSLNG